MITLLNNFMFLRSTLINIVFLLISLLFPEDKLSKTIMFDFILISLSAT